MIHWRCDSCGGIQAEATDACPACGPLTSWTGVDLPPANGTWWCRPMSRAQFMDAAAARAEPMRRSRLASAVIGGSRNWSDLPFVPPAKRRGQVDEVAI